MKRLKSLPWILVALLSFVLVSIGVLVSLGILKVSWATSGNEKEAPRASEIDPEKQSYPIPGRLEGTTAFYEWETALGKAKEKTNPSYPEWLKRNYYYKELVGPDVGSG